MNLPYALTPDAKVAPTQSQLQRQWELNLYYQNHYDNMFQDLRQAGHNYLLPPGPLPLVPPSEPPLEPYNPTNQVYPSCCNLRPIDMPPLIYMGPMRHLPTQTGPLEECAIDWKAMDESVGSVSNVEAFPKKRKKKVSWIDQQNIPSTANSYSAFTPYTQMPALREDENLQYGRQNFLGQAGPVQVEVQARPSQLQDINAKFQKIFDEKNKQNHAKAFSYSDIAKINCTEPNNNYEKLYDTDNSLPKKYDDKKGIFNQNSIHTSGINKIIFENTDISLYITKTADKKKQQEENMSSFCNIEKTSCFKRNNIEQTLHNDHTFPTDKVLFTIGDTSVYSFNASSVNKDTKIKFNKIEDEEKEQNNVEAISIHRVAKTSCTKTDGDVKKHNSKKMISNESDYTSATDNILFEAADTSVYYSDVAAFHKKENNSKQSHNHSLKHICSSSKSESQDHFKKPSTTKEFRKKKSKRSSTNEESLPKESLSPHSAWRVFKNTKMARIIPKGQLDKEDEYFSDTDIKMEASDLNSSLDNIPKLKPVDNVIIETYEDDKLTLVQKNPVFDKETLIIIEDKRNFHSNKPISGTDIPKSNNDQIFGDGKSDFRISKPVFRDDEPVLRKNKPGYHRDNPVSNTKTNSPKPATLRMGLNISASEEQEAATVDMEMVATPNSLVSDGIDPDCHEDNLASNSKINSPQPATLTKSSNISASGKQKLSAVDMEIVATQHSPISAVAESVFPKSKPGCYEDNLVSNTKINPSVPAALTMGLNISANEEQVFTAGMEVVATQHNPISNEATITSEEAVYNDNALELVQEVLNILENGPTTAREEAVRTTSPLEPLWLLDIIAHDPQVEDSITGTPFTNNGQDGGSSYEYYRLTNLELYYLRLIPDDRLWSVYLTNQTMFEMA